MLKIWIFSLISLFSLPLVESEAPKTSEAAMELCDINNQIFLSGEEITYKIYYNIGVNMAVGEVNFNVEERDDTYLISAYGRSFAFYDVVFKVRDTIETIVDKETLRPLESLRIVREGKYTGYDKVTYDYARGVAISKKGKTAETAKVEEIPIADCSRDILSIMYGMRNVSLDQFRDAQKLSVDLLMDRKSYEIDVNYLGEDKKRIKGYGKEDVHVVNPELIQSTTFSDKSAMKVYVSKDGNNLPLLIETPISVGKIKAVLDRASGLKYDS